MLGTGRRFIRPRAWGWQDRNRPSLAEFISMLGKGRNIRKLFVGFSGVIVWWRRSRLCRDGVIEHHKPSDAVFILSLGLDCHTFKEDMLIYT